MQEFDFNINASWEAAGKLLGYFVGERDPEGVAVYRERWERSKARLLELMDFGGRMTLVLDDSLEDVCTDADRRLALSAARDYLNRVGYLYPFEVIVAARRVICWLEASDISAREIALNRLLSRRPDPRPAHDGKHLESGTKLGRYVRIVAEHIRREAEQVWDSTVLSNAADLAVRAVSRATSALKDRGTQAKLVLSVNPLDMLLASMHTTGWRSCHRLNGEYCTGPLAYLLDDCSAIAYLSTGSAPCDEAGGLVLPVKIWRQMVFFDLDAGSALMSREYPDSNAPASKAARKAAATLLARHRGLDTPRWYVRYIGGSPYDNDPDELAYYVYEQDYARWHYVDWVVSRVRLNPDGKHPHVRPGVIDLPCVVCGSTRYDNERGSLLCDFCGSRVPICVSCDEPISGDVYHNPYGDDICEACFQEYYCTCELCGDVFYQEDTVVAVDAYGYEFAACDSCLINDGYNPCVCCGRFVHPRAQVQDVHDEVYCHRCASRELTECSVCGELIPNDEIYEVDSAPVCQSCVSTCSVCHSMCTDPEQDDDGDLLCPECCAERRALSDAV